MRRTDARHGNCTQSGEDSRATRFGGGHTCHVVNAGQRRRSARCYACADCFGPLEVGYDFGPVSRERIDGRPEIHLALSRPAAGSGEGRGHAAPDPAGRACCVRTGWSELGIKTLWVKDDSRQPDPLVQGPCRRGRARRRPRARLHPLRLPSTGNLANSVAAHAGWPGSVLRLHPARPRAGKSSRPRCTARPGRDRGTYDDVTGSAGAGRRPLPTAPSSTSTSGRSTPRAPRRWVTRLPSSSAGGSCAGRDPGGQRRTS